MDAKEDIFRFKQFEIIQNRLVHRVGTDGVLLGAWVDVNEAQRILDIGSGTGVISLILAQRINGKGQIVALEPDEHAFDLITRNINQNMHSKSITAINQRLQNFLAERNELKYFQNCLHFHKF